MILHDSPYGLVYSVMRDEAEKVDFFRQKEEKKLNKKLEREFVTYPFYHKAEYVVPGSKNKYIVWFYLKDKWDRNIKYGNYLEIFSQNGGRTIFYYKPEVKYSAPDMNSTCELCIYTDHFFKRYRERIKAFEGLSPTDLIIRYFSRNYYHVEGLDFKKLNLNYDKYPDGAVHQVEDGLVFVTVTKADDGRGGFCPIIKHNTFICKELLKEDQKDSVLGDEDLQSGLFVELRKLGDVKSVKTGHAMMAKEGRILRDMLTKTFLFLAEKDEGILINLKTGIDQLNKDIDKISETESQLKYIK